MVAGGLALVQAAAPHAMPLRMAAAGRALRASNVPHDSGVADSGEGSSR